MAANLGESDGSNILAVDDETLCAATMGVARELNADSPLTRRQRLSNWVEKTFTPPRSPVKVERGGAVSPNLKSVDFSVDDAAAAAEDSLKPQSRSPLRAKSSTRRFLHGASAEDDLQQSRSSAKDSTPTRQKRVVGGMFSPRSSTASEDRQQQQQQQKSGDVAITSSAAAQAAQQPHSPDKQGTQQQPQQPRPHRLTALLKGLVSPRSSRTHQKNVSDSGVCENDGAAAAASARRTSDSFSVAETNEVDSSSNLEMRKNWFAPNVEKQTKSTRMNVLEVEFKQLDLIGTPQRRKTAEVDYEGRLQYRVSDKRPVNHMNRAQKREAKVKETMKFSKMLDFLEPREDGNSAEFDAGGAVDGAERGNWMQQALCELTDEPGSISVVDETIFPRSRST